MVADSSTNSAGGQALLKLVAEELRLPLMQISRRSELAGLKEVFSAEDFMEMRYGADAALELIDGYLLGLHLAQSQQALELEPVSVASVLYETAQSLDNVAKHYDTELRLEVDKTCGPVMADVTGLKSALFSLGYALIGAQVRKNPATKNLVSLVVRRTAAGVSAGLYGENIQHITAAELRLAGNIYGHTRQPLSNLSSSSSAGIFVAGTILEAMSAKLKASKHHKQAGLAAILQPSLQLQLV